MRTRVTVIKMFGRVLLAVGILLLGSVWLLILRLKEVPVAFLVIQGVPAVGLVTAMLWPKLRHRRRLLLWLGSTAGLVASALYFTVVFYRDDLPVLLGLAAVGCLIGAVASLVRRREREAPASTVSRREVLVAGAGLVLAAGSALALNWLGRLRADEVRQLLAWREEAIGAPGRRRRVIDSSVRVFPLRTGSTVVTFGQFYGGLDGWEGLNGYLGTFVDKSQIEVPVYAYLIDHPRHGLFMVDAGVNWEQANDHDGYYNHNAGISRLLSEREEYSLTVAEDLPVQLARLGYDPAAVNTLFLTHVHDDHAGGLRNVPNASVVVDRRDWTDGVLYPYSFDFAKDRLVHPEFDSGAVDAFPQSQDYFGDGSVVLLPTPGHSPGHMCVLLRTDEGQVLFMGDTLYTVPHLAVREVRQMTIGGDDTAAQLAAAGRIQHLLRSSPNTVPLFAHDNTKYQLELVQEIFNDGLADASDYARLRQHIDSALTPDWRLRQGHRPAFAPPEVGTRIGRVEFR